MPAKGPGGIISSFECQNMTRDSVWFTGQYLMFALMNLTHCRMLANVAILEFLSDIMTVLVLSLYIEACRFTNYQYYSNIKNVYFQGLSGILYSRLSYPIHLIFLGTVSPPPPFEHKPASLCYRPGPQNPMANKATVARAVLKEAEVVHRHRNFVNNPVIWIHLSNPDQN